MYRGLTEALIKIAMVCK